MHFQVAFRQARLKLCLEGLRFLLVPAVYQSVIRVPTPRKVGVRPRHPEIERVMQEQVSQNRADYPTYAKDNFCFERVISGWRGALTVLDLRLKK
jgi:hypothetical protein